MKRFYLIFLALAGSALAQTIPADVGVFNLNGSGGGSGGSGTVTSVSFTGGLITVTNPTTTPSFTVAGTSGGIPYFNSGTTWATSAALAANSLVKGGGAGVAPSTITTGTGVLTALGVNTGSAGAFVVFNAAGGTPTSLTLTNASGLVATTGLTATGTKNSTTFLRGDDTWATPAGSGTVTVVSAGSLTSTALVTGGGTTTLQTPSATATMDSSGNISTPGTLTVGNAATTAGAVVLTQGTTQSAGTTNITIQAPTAVTSHIYTLPGTVGTNGAFWTQTTSGTTATLLNTKVVPTGTVVGTSDTQTLTAKRVTARVGSTTSSATPTINTDNVDIYELTAQTVDITSFTTNLSGTPVDGDQLEIRVTGTAARAITWGTGFVAGPAALPTTTVTTKTLYVYFEFDSVVTHWVCMFSGSLP